LISRSQAREDRVAVGGRDSRPSGAQARQMPSQRGAEAGQQLLALRLAQPSEADDDPRSQVVLRGGADRGVPAERGSGRPRDHGCGRNRQELRRAANTHGLPGGRGLRMSRVSRIRGRPRHPAGDERGDRQGGDERALAPT
jgi:hypothetical protein